MLPRTCAAGGMLPPSSPPPPPDADPTEPTPGQYQVTCISKVACQNYSFYPMLAWMCAHSDKAKCRCMASAVNESGITVIRPHSWPRPAETCGEQYTVTAADTCATISKATGVPEALLQYADASVGRLDCSSLIVGETLCTFGSSSNCAKAYRVKPGDTCESVATQLDMTSAKFRQLNPSVACPIPTAGTVLCVDLNNITVGETMCYGMWYCMLARLG